MGLYALRKRVEALNGECGVINRFDGKGGVVFWFRLRYIPQVMNKHLVLIRLITISTGVVIVAVINTCSSLWR